VIKGPARLAGMEVDPDLVARLVADTGSGDALPLLAYTLAELADGVSGAAGSLLASRMLSVEQLRERRGRGAHAVAVPVRDGAVGIGATRWAGRRGRRR
jgi:hypothetical protein